MPPIRKGISGVPRCSPICAIEQVTPTPARARENRAVWGPEKSRLLTGDRSDPKADASSFWDSGGSWAGKSYTSRVGEESDESVGGEVCVGGKGV